MSNIFLFSVASGVLAMGKIDIMGEAFILQKYAKQEQPGIQ